MRRGPATVAAVVAVLALAVGGTSGSAAQTTPEAAPPDLVGAVAISQNEVTVQMSEPLRPDTVDTADFALDMAGVARPISALRIEPDGAQITLTSPSTWGHGEAGNVTLGPPGSVLDVDGNANQASTTRRVAAAPGDFVPPVASSLSIRPRSFCLTRSRTCRRTGTTVSFVAGEAGRAHLVLMRGDRPIGTDVALSEAGRNRIRFTGRLGNRKLSAGNYRMLLYLEDEVGNLTVEPPIQLFSVRRATPGGSAPARRR